MRADVIAAARAIWAEAQDVALASSPLAAMPEWIRTGQPPPLADFRRWGFDGAPDDERSLMAGAVVRRWGFSLPCKEAAELLVGLGPMVEVGAGTGYWSALLAAAGADAIATDATPAGTTIYHFKVGQHHPTLALTAAEAVALYPDRAVFCSWPSRGESWLSEAIERMHPGRVLALISEPEGGKTGDGRLFSQLRESFDLVGRCELPRLPGNRDALSIYRRC